MILFQFIQCIFVSSLMKLSPNEIIQGEGVTQTKKNTLASAVRQSQEAHGENFPIGQGWENHEKNDH